MNPDASSCGDDRGTEDVAPAVSRWVRAPRLRGLVATSGALVVGVSFAVVSAGVSFAYLNSAATSGAASTIASGSSGLNVQYNSGTAASSVTIPASVYQNMLPGDVIGVQLNLINVGDVPQSVGAAISATSAWETRIATGGCPSTVLSGAALTTTSAGSIALAVGATQNICLQVTLPSSASAASENTTVSYTVTFTGTQTP